MSSIAGPDPPVTVFIKSWNRPSYLWACLDSFYRHTRHGARFVLIDNCSDDPQVRQIVEGFQHRGMLSAVHFMDVNELTNQDAIYDIYKDSIGPYLVLVDGDVAVEPSDPCWLEQMVRIADERPRLAMLGSYVCKDDFVDMDLAVQRFPGVKKKRLRFLIKAESQERRLPDTDEEIIRPFNPPGRFTLLRTDAIRELGLRSGGFRFYTAAVNAGWDAGIAVRVRHRHLSLLNLFDYPEYDDLQRNAYFGAPTPRTPRPG